MSDCDYQHLVAALHDGELEDPAQRERVEAHVRSCGACEARLAELRRITSLFDAVPRPKLSPAGWTQLHARVSEEVNADQEDGVILRIARRLAIAAAVVLVVSALWLYQLSRTGDAGTVATAGQPAHAVGTADAAMTAGAPVAWDAVALAGANSFESTDRQFAEWVVSNLSSGSGGDGAY